MNIAIRTDSSRIIGTGHVMRCLTLAGALREKGADIVFICRNEDGNINDFIKQKAYQVSIFQFPINSPDSEFSHDRRNFPWQLDAEKTIRALQNSGKRFDLLIVDHYSLDHKWEELLKPFVKKIMIIDDLADRSHNCDILLDQNIQERPDRYKNLANDNCRMLLGPQFALLRPEFIEARRNVQVRNGIVNNMLVFFGGADLTNETEKTIHAINMLARKNFSITVIVGKSNPHKSKIKALCSHSQRFIYYCQVNNMAVLMSEASLGIGAGGSSTWERCATGLPSLIISVADNQIPIAKNITRKKAQIYLGHYSKVTREDICCAISELLESPELVKELSANSLNITDARGTEKVIQTIFSRCN